MEDSKYKDFLEQRHPELLKEAEDFFDVSDRGTWEYVCKLMPKLADLDHEQVKSDNKRHDYGWYVHKPVQVGNRTAQIGIKLWIHAYKIVGNNWTKVKLKDNEHYIEFYAYFDIGSPNGSCTCYQTMTNLPGMVGSNGNGETFPVDIPTKREQIYKFLGI